MRWIAATLLLCAAPIAQDVGTYRVYVACESADEVARVAFDGKTAKETGTRMGRSETAVHSLYRRALEAWDQAAGKN